MTVIGLTGGSGTIGSMLVRYLGRRTDVRLLVLTRRPLSDLPANAEALTGSLRDLKALKALAGQSDVVIHLAAKNPGPSEEVDRSNAADFFETNVLGTDRLARCLRLGQHFVHASSVAVYELSRDREAKHEEDESLPGNPAIAQWVTRADEAFASATVPSKFLAAHPVPEGSSVYSLSKYLGELRVRNLRNRIILRISDVYGPGHETRGVVQDAFEDLLQRDGVRLDFGARAKVSFLYMRNALEAISAAALNPGLKGEHCINVVNPHSIGEEIFADSLREAAPELSDRIRVERAELPTMSRAYAAVRMREVLGVDEPVPLAEGLRETLAYLRLPADARGEYLFSEAGIQS